ncbi:MAG TPA: alcohol dehydrogenase catalytic domain-containing protein, partial [Actinomycetes bacterium]|nr:alcohol dehydrogenase catalytic domain-containing protein [Actinomycetes bacterium]
MPRSLVLDGPRQLRLSDQPARPLRPGEIRLRARLSGISHGTELSLYRGTSAFTDKVFDRGLRVFVEPQAGSAAAYPVTLGYEMVAEVLEVGPDVTEVAVGDLVHTGTPHQEETVLDLASSLGATYPLVRLPTTERPERALFISLAAVALQAVHDAEMKLGDAVSVHGLGTIGLLVVQMCRLEGI